MSSRGTWHWRRLVGRFLAWGNDTVFPGGVVRKREAVLGIAWGVLVIVVGIGTLALLVPRR